MVVSNTAPVDPAPVAAGLAVPVAPAVPHVQEVCKIEVRGTAQFLNATDALSGMPLPGSLQPLRYPLQRLPRVLRDHCSSNSH